MTWVYCPEGKTLQKEIWCPQYGGGQGKCRSPLSIILLLSSLRHGWARPALAYWKGLQPAAALKKGGGELNTSMAGIQGPAVDSLPCCDSVMGPVSRAAGHGSQGADVLEQNFKCQTQNLGLILMAIGVNNLLQEY